MDHEVSWDDDNGCVRLTLRGQIEAEHARALMAAAEQLFEGKTRRLLLIDHRQSPQALPPETREVFQTRSYPLEKLSFFGMGHITRIAARIAVAIAGHSDHSRFFETEAEALAWLHE